MRILIDIAAIARGGMERQVILLSGALHARGHEVLIVAQKSVSDYRDELSRADVPFVELGCHSPADIRVLPRLIGEIRRFAPDVILCENFNATLWGRLAALRCGVPVVTAEHTTDRPIELKVKLTNLMLARKTAATIACAHAQVDFLVREGNRREAIEVIHNGIDPSMFVGDPSAGQQLRKEFGIPSDAFVVGLVAAHRPEKCHSRFFQLIEGLIDHGIDVWGLDVGGGPLLEQNRELAQRSNSADRLMVIGPRADVVAAYSAMDVLVFVSDLETFPMAALEAQACATPVFALSAGGLKEAVDPGRTGVVVGAGDLPALTRALIDAIEEPGRLEAMGAAARGWVSGSFTTDRMTEQFIEVFTSVSGRT